MEEYAESAELPRVNTRIEKTETLQHSLLVLVEFVVVAAAGSQYHFSELQQDQLQACLYGQLNVCVDPSDPIRIFSMKF